MNYSEIELPEHRICGLVAVASVWVHATFTVAFRLHSCFAHRDCTLTGSLDIMGRIEAIHRIVRSYDSFMIQRKFQLISALDKGIILIVYLVHHKYNYTIIAGSFGTRLLC